MARDVTHDDQEGAVVEFDQVVPVAADIGPGGGGVDRIDLRVLQLGQLREQRVLEFAGDVLLAGVQPTVLEGQRRASGEVGREEQVDVIERLPVGLAEDRQDAEDAPTDRHRHEYQRAHPEFVEDGDRRAGLARCLQGGLVVEDDERPRPFQHGAGHRHVLQTTFGIGGERRDRLADIRLAVADECLCRIIVGGGDEHERPLGEPFDDDLEHPFDRRGRIHRGDQRAADVGHHLDAAERLLGSVARGVRLRNGDARLDLRRGGRARGR